jgi:ribosomal protection tetracycline resistance protein
MERFGIAASFSSLRTIYKEKPTKTAYGSIRIGEKWNHYHAGIMLSVEPLPDGSGFEYESKVSYGYLEKSFQNAVYEGVSKSIYEGFGYEITDVRVTILDADYESVMGTPSDFRSLVPFVVRQALSSAELIRLEPWQSYTLTAPLESENRIISDLVKMRAVIENVRHDDAELTATGLIPLDTSKEYSTDLLIETKGKGLFLSQFYRYVQLQ